MTRNLIKVCNTRAWIGDTGTGLKSSMLRTKVRRYQDHAEAPKHITFCARAVISELAHGVLAHVAWCRGLAPPGSLATAAQAQS